MTRQLGLFGFVGAVAAALHLLTVIQLVPLGANPLIANVGGFAIAFGVSFIGHSLLTFPSSSRAHLPTLGRFLLLALLGFGCNETLYWILLSTTELDYRPALVAVLLIVAAGTFVLGKYWAFSDD